MLVFLREKNPKYREKNPRDKLNPDMTPGWNLGSFWWEESALVTSRLGSRFGTIGFLKIQLSVQKKAIQVGSCAQTLGE